MSAIVSACFDEVDAGSPTNEFADKEYAPTTNLERIPMP